MIFIFVAASWARAESRHKIEAAASGEATVESKGSEIYDLLLKVASGQASKSEAQGLGDYEFVPWQIGAVM